MRPCLIVTRLAAGHVTLLPEATPTTSATLAVTLMVAATPTAAGEAGEGMAEEAEAADIGKGFRGLWLKGGREEMQRK